MLVFKSIHKGLGIKNKTILILIFQLTSGVGFSVGSGVGLFEGRGVGSAVVGFGVGCKTI